MSTHNFTSDFCKLLQWNLDITKDWQNLLAITRFRYIEVLFRIFFYYWGGSRGRVQGVRTLP